MPSRPLVVGMILPVGRAGEGGSRIFPSPRSSVAGGAPMSLGKGNVRAWGW